MASQIVLAKARAKLQQTGKPPSGGFLGRPEGPISSGGGGGLEPEMFYVRDLLHSELRVIPIPTRAGRPECGSTNIEPVPTSPKIPLCDAGFNMYRLGLVREILTGALKFASSFTPQGSLDSSRNWSLIAH